MNAHKEKEKIKKIVEDIKTYLIEYKNLGLKNLSKTLPETFETD